MNLPDPSRRRFLALMGLGAAAPLACSWQSAVPQPATPAARAPTVTPAGSLERVAEAKTPGVDAVACEPAPLPIVQPSAATPAGFAAYAEQMRQQAVAAGDQSFGAVLVRDDHVVGLGPSRVVTGRDPTGHAEMEAIRDAARRLGTADLSGSVLYSTSRPCRMCETAAYWARVTRMWHGPGPADGGQPRPG